MADIVDWISATVAFEARDFGSTARYCEALLKRPLKSPVSGSAAVLAARAYIGAGNPAKAVELLARHQADLPQPEGDAALAGAYDAMNDSAHAVVYDQRVWLNYPTSAEAQGAEAELRKHRQEMGSDYPEPSAQALLARAGKLLDARQYDPARRELTAISQRFTGAARELALVRIGDAMRRNRKDASSLDYLASLQLSSPEADAERLYQTVAAARRFNRLDVMEGAVDRLTRRYPNSEWRQQALVAAGNEYLLRNDVAQYEPLYRACFAAFPRIGQAAYCHWKVAFRAYLENRKEAADLLREQVRDYPESEAASAAMYYLGRMAERAGAHSDARAWYDHLQRSFPNYYYGILARDRREQPAIAHASASPAVAAFLRPIRFPGKPLPASFDPPPAARARIDRSRLLRAAALDELAELELRFAAKSSDRPEIFGLELARSASARQAPDRAIRYLKRYAPGYLYSPVASAPREFWKLAFPLPWRQPLFQYSQQAGLDPYMVAALIRQESEFDPRAISGANAYGLTQILPSTGRELSRRLRVRGFTPSMLFRPEFNLRLGAQYLKTQLSGFDGRWEPTLAAYNAGKTRAVEWLNRAEYREPAEYVESIPYTETRNYVQVVMRNADLYRRVYKD
ncbi:MAG: lytic transglycosylase domain-containing protein [Acidobacteria bacterium]|nr:lytic transglycosylase domain-containing protein [Acidobacteriota bacterium]